MSEQDGVDWEALAEVAVEALWPGEEDKGNWLVVRPIYIRMLKPTIAAFQQQRRDQGVIEVSRDDLIRARGWYLTAEGEAVTNHEDDELAERFAALAATAGEGST